MPLCRAGNGPLAAFPLDDFRASNKKSPPQRAGILCLEKPGWSASTLAFNHDIQASRGLLLLNS
jgi:hypothetical protein